MNETAPRRISSIQARDRAALLAIVSLAVALRLLHLAFVHDAPFVGALALDSQEYDRWAREIAGGDVLGTAPFFQAPLYPYLVASIYALAGPRPLAVYLLQIAAAAGACVALFAAGRRLGGSALGVVAGLLFALYTPFWFYDAQLLKESFATALVCVLLWSLIAARDSGAAERARPWLVAGLVAGAIALLRENMLLVVPFLLPAVIVGAGEPKAKLRRAALFLLGVALPLLPVAARNAALGGGFLPTTSQGGVNFWIGNNPEADGTYRPLVPGKQIPAYEREEARRLAEAASGRPLAAAEVSRYWFGRSIAWARERPLDFLRLQAKKLRLYFSGYEWPDAVDYYWMKTISPPLRLPLVELLAVALLAAAGAVLVRHELARWSPVLLFELGWIATTVAFFLFSRYRLPAVPGMLLLAAVPVVRTAALFRDGRRSAALAAVAATAAVALAFAAPHLAGYRPRLDLVEFNLGRLAEGRGDAVAATTHYEAALAADPRSFSPTLTLGTLAARSGDYETARRRFSAAVAIAPDSDDAHANLGGALLALGELDAARAELERALALNPEHRAARANLALLAGRAAANSP